ncbi:helix-turn-helix domain-containing protein [Myroides sp. N17-2]|uniref:helix-turn-helix domain-containing protein n=1 Tax=Myroides sp. N17-2 TaxID=2030799 RepID=UPI001C1FA302|nr:helix-turn-helix transcriptional regulator [Myroides sp. N17-2]
MNKIKTYTLDSVVDETIGVIGTPNRDRFEEKIKIELIGKKIKEVRQEKKMTQEELGKLVGVQRAQISKIENSTLNVGLSTIYKVFEALGADISFSVAYNFNK